MPSCSWPTRRSSMAKENQAAFENMKVNLLANRLVPEKVPLVFQYNKQDLPEVMSAAELDKALNPWGRRAFGAVAAQGKGVLECFVAVVQDMLAAIAVKYNLKEKGLDPVERARRRPGGVRGGAEERGRGRARRLRRARPPPAKVVVSQQTDSLHAAPPQTGSETGLVSEELLHRSMRSNVELAEALAGLVREMNLGLGSILSQAELLMFYREDAREKRQVAIAGIQQEAARLRRVVAELGDASADAAGATPDPLGSTRPADRAHRLLALDRRAGSAPGRRPLPPRPGRSRPPPPRSPPMAACTSCCRTSSAALRMPSTPRSCPSRCACLRARSCRAARPSPCARRSRARWKGSSPLPSAARSSRCAASASRSSSRDATARSSATS